MKTAPLDQFEIKLIFLNHNEIDAHLETLSKLITKSNQPNSSTLNLSQLHPDLPNLTIYGNNGAEALFFDDRNVINPHIRFYLTSQQPLDIKIFKPLLTTLKNCLSIIISSWNQSIKPTVKIDFLSHQQKTSMMQTITENPAYQEEFDLLMDDIDLIKTQLQERLTNALTTYAIKHAQPVAQSKSQNNHLKTLKSKELK